MPCGIWGDLCCTIEMVLERMNFEVRRFKCFLKIAWAIYRALCFHAYFLLEPVLMYYLGVSFDAFFFLFPHSLFFFPSLGGKGTKGSYFLPQEKILIFQFQVVWVFASWGIVYFLEILNQVIHIVMGLITCLSRYLSCHFNSPVRLASPVVRRRCAQAIVSSLKTRMCEMYPPVQTRLWVSQIQFSAAFIAVHMVFSVFLC